MKRSIEMQGGPLDGLLCDNDGYFQEGDSEAVDTMDLSRVNPQWSPESVYVVRGGILVYDADLTKKREAITAPAACDASATGGKEGA